MKISVYIATTVDGFIASDDGDVSWLDEYNEDPDEDYGFGSFFASVDCLVMGRKTFEKVLSFEEWGYAGKSPDKVRRQDRQATAIACKQATARQ